MWKKSENEPQGGVVEDRPKPRVNRPAGAQGGAVIGDSIVIDGDVSGSEDLTIFGRIKGQVSLPEHTLRVGAEGRLEAKARARRIEVDGRVKGDLSAEQEIIIRKTGDVRGNLVAPRIGLEEGAKFRGSIDMEPKASRGPGKAPVDQRKPDGSAASENKATG